jgi:hypothetical protein
MGAGEDARVAGQHAVDVGPDLDLVGGQGCADDGGSVVGAAAAEGRDDTVFGRADEAADHGHSLRGDPAAKQGIGFNEKGRSLRVPAVGDDDFARVEVDGVDACLAQSRGNDEAGEALPEARYGIGESRGRRSPVFDLAQDLAELVEQRPDIVGELQRLGAARQLRRFDEMKTKQSLCFAARGRDVSFAGEARDGEQPVCCLSHRRNHDCGTKQGVIANDRGNPLNGCCGL